MRKVCIISLYLFFCIVYSEVLYAQTKVYNVGIFNSYPLVYKEEGKKPEGIYIDLLEEIAQKENIHFNYVFGTWDDGFERIKNGQVDMLMSVGFTKQRAEFMDYCKNPILTLWGELYTLPSSQISSVLDVSNKKIAVLKSDIFAKMFKELTQGFSLSCEFVELDSYAAVFIAVKEAKVDAGIVDVTFGASNQVAFGLKASGIVFNPLDVFFTTAKDKNSELRDLLDKYLEIWKRDEHSIYNDAKLKWIHGSVGSVEVMPEWISQALFFILFILIVAFVFIVALNIRVKKALAKQKLIENQILSISNNFQNGMVYQLKIDKNGYREFTYLSDSCKLLYGISPKEGMADSSLIYGTVYEDDVEYLAHEEEKSIKNLSTLKAEFRIKDPNGSIRWSYLVAEPKMFSDGTIYFDGIEFVITARKEAENKIKHLLEEKELLLREVHHRIKNNMNTIKGLLALQINAEKNESCKDSLEDAESRVQSIIMLYDKLYCTDNFRELAINEYIEPLANEIIASFASPVKITASIEICDYVLNLQILTPLGIIVNELLTNMMKYAFVGREHGSISILIQKNKDLLFLKVSDNGKGLPEHIDFNNSTGFGMKLIGMVLDQINGTVKIERNNGSAFTFIIPV